jgi:hypothetical protein
VWRKAIEGVAHGHAGVWVTINAGHHAVHEHAHRKNPG